MNKRYCVRVTQSVSNDVKRNEGGELNDAFLHCLRYAGLIETYEKLHDPSIVTCFDIYCPNQVKNSQLWAEELVEFMRSFGFNVTSV